MERCPELEDLTRQLYEAVSTGDIAWFERYVSRADGIVVTGTEAEEWWESRDDLLAAMRAQMAAGNGVELVGGDVRAYRQGDAGWIADRPMLRVGGIEVQCRHTSVFVREGSEWRLVQHHFSIGVANEDVFGEEVRRLG